MIRLPLLGEAKARPAQPYSRQTLDKHARTRGATVTESVCPYCAVGCSTRVYSKGGQVVDIEGNPDSPINEGTLCPKGANIFQLQTNPHRVTHVLWRAPYADTWEVKPLDWAMERIARLVKQTRDEHYEEKTSDGQSDFNAVRAMGCLGGATLDNEENYLIKKLFSAGLQVLSIENQARI